MKHTHHSRNRSRVSSDRRGSTLLIVLVLMGMLALLGVLFYTLASQANATASSFSADARVLEAPSLEPDALMDYALEQLILGPEDTKVHSALWGGRHSLVPNMLGRDGIPFNGEGVHVIDDSTNTGDPLVDQDYNGSGGDSWLLGLNDSPSANGGDGFRNGGVTITDLPAPDVDYTYPDANHAFLSYRARVPDPVNPTTAPPVEIILPSFHRPGLLDRARREIVSPSGAVTADLFWFGDTTSTSPATATRVFRPHGSHRSFGSSGTSNRFVLPTSLGPITAADVTTLKNLGLRNLFPAPPDLDGNQIFGEQGAYQTNDSNRSEIYEYDLDLDGDGIRESILMDLDFPPQRRGDGKLVLPMFAFHIVDANALINLNVAGNVAGNLSFASLGMREFGSEESPPSSGTYVNSTISKSNLGYSTAEINPVYALSADPTHASLSGSALTQHEILMSMFGANTPATRRELANLEWLMLNVGRPAWNPSLVTSGDDAATLAGKIGILVSGRFGESSRLRNALSYAASNAANLYTVFPFPGTSEVDDNGNNALYNPLFGSPVDPKGVGNPFNTSGQKLNRYQLSNAPVVWPRYSRYNVSSSGNDVRWATAQSGNLMTDTDNEGRMDEVGELIVAPEFYASQDEIFPPEETAALHYSETDVRRMAVASRLKTLAPANFLSYRNGSTASPDSAADIRKRFTSISNDRREFGIPVSSQTGSQFRQWETSGGFPPDFGSGLPANLDPFRDELRELFDQNTTDSFGRLKLDLNRALSSNGTNLQFRQLVDYDVDDTRARQDRQRLARDLYVLLYTFCGGRGTDASLLTSNPYTAAEAKAMAQFAVNVVDAVDRDDEITEFWYDANLSDGWDPDQKVFGVERQLLAFTEGLAVRTPDGLTADNPNTMHEENGARHDYLFMELMNVSPFDVNLYEGTRDLWRITREDDDIDGTGDEDDVFDANDCRITIRDTNRIVVSGNRYVIASQDGSMTGAGGLYWSSEIRVRGATAFDRVVPLRPDSGMAPTNKDTDNPASFPPIVDLDLCYDTHTSRFSMSVPSGPGNPGRMVNPPPVAPSMMSANPEYHLRLERRGRGYRDGITSPGNTDDWAIVDKLDVQVDINNWSYNDTDSGATILNSLNNNVQAWHRKQPLRRAEAPDGYLSRTVVRSTFKPDVPMGSPHDPEETLAQDQIDLQLHFDRDLMSVAELLDIPVFGPRDLTDSGFKPGTQNSTAGSYFLRTDRNCGGPGNRWYRLLSMVEVVPQVHRSTTIVNEASNATPTLLEYALNLPQGYGLPSVPGQINLNTLRHHEVLAALLDDSRVFDGFSPELVSGGMDNRVALPGGSSWSSNSWWYELLFSRDGIDDLTQLPLPGVSLSQPFRGFGNLNGATDAVLQDNRGLQSTILRSLTTDVSGTDHTTARRMFEVGTSMEHTSNTLDPYARDRFYRKLMNNGTLRSNTFLVYVGVQFHEAALDANGAVRVGGRLENTPLHRGFFVIDRGEVVDQVRKLMRDHAFVADHWEESGGTVTTKGLLKQIGRPPASAVEYFSYRALTSTDPLSPDGIDWRALIKFRQLLN